MQFLAASGQGVGQPGQGVQRVAQHVASVAFTGGFSVDGHCAAGVLQVQGLPVRPFRPQHDAGVPGVVGGHSQEVEVAVIGAPVVHQLEGGHQRAHRRRDSLPSVGRAAGGQAGLQAHRDLAFRAETDVIAGVHRRRGVMHSALKNRSGAGGVKPDHPLHHRRGQRNLVAHDGPALRGQQRLKRLLHIVGFLDGGG